ncbi:MAG: hypothetical protein ABFD92_13655 [Planctomycetaceae bacterium]|nr:hypothetical protein [Planctomycetaceae bacterium]
MKSARWLFVVVAVAALAAGGCKDKSSTTTPSGGTEAKPAAKAAPKASVNLDTPKATLESLDKAVRAMDVDAITACAAPEYQKPVGVMMATLKDIQAKEASARKAVTEKFGKEAADATFQNSMSASDTPLKGAMENGKVNWEKVVIKTEGDAATVEIAGKADDDLNMKKIGGKWYVVPNEPAAEMAKKAEQAKAMMSKMGEAYASFEKQVRDGKVEKDKLGDTLAGEMMKTMTPPAAPGAPAAPATPDAPAMPAAPATPDAPAAAPEE